MAHLISLLLRPHDCPNGLRPELGAGYGFFINEVIARRKIAVDSWAGFVNCLQSGIESRVCDVTDLSFLEPSSVNFVFASNLFEHISQDDLSTVLCQLKTALAEQWNPQYPAA